MSGKKQANKATAAPAVAAKPKKVNPATRIKRNADGSKIMKVARGTARNARRKDLQDKWNGKYGKLKPAAQAAA